MRRSTLLVFALVLIGVGVAGSQVRPGMSYESGSMAFPVGDTEAGHAVFVVYRCAACHRVAEDAGLPAPVAANGAPELGMSQASQKACELVESIVSPSHRTAADVQARTLGELSPMGEVNDTMTVRELIDLVAYLKSLGPGTKYGLVETVDASAETDRERR